MDSEVLSILDQVGAWLPEGHYQLISGDHSPDYVNCRIALGDERHCQTIGQHLAQLFESDKIDLVVGILPSGALLAPVISEALGAPWCLARAEHGSFTIIHKTSRAPARGVLIVDDVLTTGGPLRTIIRLLKERNYGTVKSFGVIVDRSARKPSPNLHFESLVRRPMSLYHKSECPMCAKGVPLWDLSDPYMNPMRQIVSAGDRQVRLLYDYYVKVYEKARDFDRAKRTAQIPEEATLEDAGHKEQRVAVLGAHETDSNIHDIAEFVARRLGCYAITGKFIYMPQTGTAVPFKHGPSESMNDHLRKMIHGSRYVLAIHTVPSGEMIETHWCSEAHKPTLGLAVFGRIFREPDPKCKYLRFYPGQQYCRCARIAALGDGSPDIGAWICKSLPSEKMCPFVQHNLPSMVLDLYCLNQSMTLIGSYSLSKLKGPIRAFIKNNGILK